tara:strand:+ start:6379 stop:8199 length:1821 start_codon:yes stop_codon:yes gene_type:complete
MANTKLQRSYLAKDFVGFRNELLNHAKIYFPNNMQDFSEASLGGMFLEMAAYVGDSMAFYLDHQFNELSYETVVETSNLEQHLRTAGVQVSGASPAAMNVKFYILVPSTLNSSGDYSPDPSALPKFKKGTRVSTTSGVDFELSHDLDFSDKNTDGEYEAEILSSNRRNGIPESFFLIREGLCVSGTTKSEIFAIPNTDTPFREIRLSNASVSQINGVHDTDGNEYYEVESLSQDTVFKAVANNRFATDGVRFNLQVLNAERRYVKFQNIQSRSTTIQFGSGAPSSLNDDIIPDPSQMALPLFGKTTLTKFSIDPNSILKSRTLGVYPKNTTITVNYRYGGGASHNVPVAAATAVTGLDITFPPSCTITNRNSVINSIDVKNDKPATGGANAPTLAELRAMIPASRSMQNRIVTRQDLLARLYTLPAEFGRLFRASIINNPNNPLASTLHVISRDRFGKLTTAPDALKQNLSTYLNEFRLVSNALDILDTDVINFKLLINIVARPGVNSADVANKLINELIQKFNINNFEIGMPIIESEIINLILNVNGVQALDSINFISQTGTILDRKYSDTTYNFDLVKSNGMFFIPQNAIFEMKYPEFDITVNI